MAPVVLKRWLRGTKADEGREDVETQPENPMTRLLPALCIGLPQ